MNIVEFRVSAVYMGGVPLTDHLSSYLGNTRFTGDEFGFNVTLGDT